MDLSFLLSPEVIGTVVAVASGGAVKVASKRKDKEVHKLLSPLAALAVGTAAAAIGGDGAVETVESGAKIALTAIGLHSAWKNARQFKIGLKGRF